MAVVEVAVVMAMEAVVAMAKAVVVAVVEATAAAAAACTWRIPCKQSGSSVARHGTKIGNRQECRVGSR